jgi:hypothetical protein
MPSCYYKDMTSCPRNHWVAFLQGLGSGLVLYPRRRRPRVTRTQHSSIEDALSSDWETIGRDLWSAVDTVVPEVSEADCVGRR